MQGTFPARTLLFEQFYTQILTVKKQGCLEKHKDFLGGIPELLLPPLHECVIYMYNKLYCRKKA